MYDIIRFRSYTSYPWGSLNGKNEVVICVGKNLKNWVLNSHTKNQVAFCIKRGYKYRAALGANL